MRSTPLGASSELFERVNKMSLTFIQATITKSAPFVGAAVDISGIVGDWTVKVRAHGDESAPGGAPSLLAGQNAGIVIEESSDNFGPVSGR